MRKLPTRHGLGSVPFAVADKGLSGAIAAPPTEKSARIDQPFVSVTILPEIARLFIHQLVIQMAIDTKPLINRQRDNP